MAEYQYDAFISYRHLQLDKAVAKKLHTLIETYHIPASVQKLTGKKKMGKVFRDEEELPLAVSLSDNIKIALQQSEWLIAICTPALLESRWCMFEIDYFIELGRRDKILLVLADGTPATSFPKQLLTREVDGETVSVEPLAANIVADDTAKSLKLLDREKLRILAPMLGVNYDDLKRRARQRKIRLITSVTAAVLAAGIALGAYFITSQKRAAELRAEAEEQQRIAEEQQRIAEEQKAKAEEERQRAEEERLRAEEEQRKKEEEQARAVNNEIGERLEKASSLLTDSEKRSAASVLLGALKLSDENGSVRHDEIISLMRRTAYIEPFTIISAFQNDNIRVNDIVVSPGGQYAAGIVNQNAVAMIDLNKNEILYQVSAGHQTIHDLAFSADGSRFLALCDTGRFITVWNTEDGSEAFSYTSKKNQPYHIANVYFWKDSSTVFVQDMEQFFLVSEDGTETLFYTLGEQMEEYDKSKNFLSQIVGKQLEEFLTFHTDDYSGTQVILSEDRSKVLIAGKGGDTAMIVLDDTGKKITLLRNPIDPESYMPGVFTEKWSLSPDGKTASCLSLLGLLGGWDTDTGNMILIDFYSYEQGFDYSEIAYSPDSKWMAFTEENTMIVADARTGEPTLQATIDETRFVPSVRFSQDGRYLMLINESMFIINTSDWAAELSIGPDTGDNFNNIVSLENSFLITTYYGRAYFFSMPELASVTKSDRFTGDLCDQPSPFMAGSTTVFHGEHELSEGFKTSTVYTDLSSRMFSSRDGNTIAIAYADGVIELFDANGDGSVQTVIGELNSRPDALAMTETTLVACDQNLRFMIYDLETRTVKKAIPSGTVYSEFAFDPAGDYVMALSDDGKWIDVYELASGDRLFQMHAQMDDAFVSMAFSTDGGYAVGTLAVNGYMIGNLWKDEAALIERTELLAPKGE